MEGNNTYVDKLLAEYLAPESGNTSETTSERLWRKHRVLGKIDELVLLAVYSTPNSDPESIALMFIRMTREPVWTGTIRIILERLEERGLVESSIEDRFTVTEAASEALGIDIDPETIHF